VKKSSTLICGFSCRLPGAANTKDFWAQLMAKKDLVTEGSGRGWNPVAFGLPQRSGKLLDYKKFDNLFFKIHSKQAEKMDPQLRMLLEVSYEAMADAFIRPDELAQVRTGVYIGACGSDAKTVFEEDLESLTGYENTGCSPSMFANRLSYTFNLTGPSLTIDTACASSLTAFDCAYKAISSGECDAALVGGTSFIYLPNWAIGFNKLQMLSPDGACRAFDADARRLHRSQCR
jgi:fatty acid synthase